MPHAKIATHQAKLTLEQLHAELAGKIIDNKKQARQLIAAMKHVEAVLKLMEPGYNLRPIAIRRRRPNLWFKRGTVFRAVLDVLRKASEPLTVKEIVARMLATKSEINAPEKAKRDLWGAVQAALRSHKGGDISEDATVKPARWSIGTVRSR